MQLEEYIKLEQTRAIYKNFRLTLMGPLIVCSVTFWVLWSSQASNSILTAWFLATFIIALLRWLTGKGAKPNTISINNHRYWVRLSMFWSSMTGLHWGLISVLLVSSQANSYTLFVTFIFSGYIASAVSTNSAFTPAFLSFATPASLVFAAPFLYQGDQLQNIVGYMILFFFLVSCMLSRNAQALFMEARELNFKNMALMEELVVQKNNAEQATLSKDRFLAAASHDLRQPLHSAGLLLSALGEYVNKDEGINLLKDLNQNNEALNHSFNSLLDMSRLDAGVIVPQKQHLALDTLITPLEREYRLLAEQEGLTLTFNGASPDLAIYSDPILLERVLHNLISNAIHYTESGTIDVSWNKSPGQRARIIIKDSGIGIEASELEEIFSEYYQINNPERDRNKGFGLGLAIVKRLSGIIGVDLYVSSQPRQSTTFCLYVPLGDVAKAEKKRQQAWAPANLRGTIVLVIDDDLSVIKSMNKLLKSWGCEVLSAESGQQAIEHIVDEEADLDIIISDYRLREGKTGVQAINRIFDELNTTIPAIIVTGDTSPDRLKSITESGFPVLHKPVSAALLRSAIQQRIGSNKNQ